MQFPQQALEFHKCGFLSHLETRQFRRRWVEIDGLTLKIFREEDAGAAFHPQRAPLEVYHCEDLWAVRVDRSASPQLPISLQNSNNLHINSNGGGKGNSATLNKAMDLNGQSKLIQTNNNHNSLAISPRVSMSLSTVPAISAAQEMTVPVQSQGFTALQSHNIRSYNTTKHPFRFDIIFKPQCYGEWPYALCFSAESTDMADSWTNEIAQFMHLSQIPNTPSAPTNGNVQMPPNLRSSFASSLNFEMTTNNVFNGNSDQYLAANQNFSHFNNHGGELDGGIADPFLDLEYNFPQRTGIWMTLEISDTDFPGAPPSLYVSTPVVHDDWMDELLQKFAAPNPLLTRRGLRFRLLQSAAWIDILQLCSRHGWTLVKRMNGSTVGSELAVLQRSAIVGNNNLNNNNSNGDVYTHQNYGVNDFINGAETQHNNGVDVVSASTSTVSGSESSGELQSTGSSSVAPSSSNGSNSSSLISAP